MKHSLGLILFFLCTSIQAQVYLNGLNYYSVDGNVFILEEQGKPLSIQESWQYFRQKKFMPIATPGNDFNLGFVKDFYWLVIPVKKPLINTQSLVAGIDNGGIFYLEFYLLDTTGKLMHQYITGTNYDFNSRPVVNRRFYFPLDFDQGTEAIIFYRVDMRGNGFHIPLRIVQRDYVKSEEANMKIFYAFFSGWLAFVALFSLIAFFWSRDRVYLYYSFYVICFCFVFLGDGNFDVEWIYPHLPWLATISPSVYVLSMCFFMLLFMSDFLHLKVTHKKLFIITRIWQVLIFISILLLAAAYIFSTNTSFRSSVFYYCFVAFTSAWLLQIYCIICRIRDRFKPAYIYGLSLAGGFFSSAVYLLHVLNIIPGIIPPHFYLSFGFAFEIVLLSIALLYSYNFYKKQHHQLSLDIAHQQLEFSKELIAVQETEQKRIAEDLHDELGGNLAAIKMNLQSLDIKEENLSTVIQLIDKASGNARNIAHNLMPPEFEGTKLEDLLQNFYNRINREGNIRFNFIVSGTDGHFDKQQSLIIYRVLLELTNNIIKHSGASKATIQLVNDKGCLEILAEDNGKGFTDKQADGIGLKNIQSRVGFLKGDCNIDSSAAGTTIIIRIPYTQ